MYETLFPERYLKTKKGILNVDATISKRRIR